MRIKWAETDEKNSLVREGSFLHIFSALVMKTSFQGRAFSLSLCCQSRKKETKTRDEGESPLNECMIELMWGKREKSLDDLVKTIIYECIRNAQPERQATRERETERKNHEKDTERKRKDVVAIVVDEDKHMIRLFLRVAMLDPKLRALYAWVCVFLFLLSSLDNNQPQSHCCSFLLSMAKIERVSCLFSVDLRAHTDRSEPLRTESALMNLERE